MSLADSIAAYQRAVTWIRERPDIPEMLARLYCDTWDHGGTVFFCGNGGSAADAQHVAAEYVGRYLAPNRRALRAIALTTDTSILTAVANDWDYTEVFARQLDALARPADILVLHSTSGRSPNLAAAVNWARRHELSSVALLGSVARTGASIVAQTARIVIHPEVPDGPSTQLSHMIVQHLAAEIVDAYYTQELAA
jgi:D-sedoheptulose 7-phosphate isomerase